MKNNKFWYRFNVFVIIFLYVSVFNMSAYAYIYNINSTLNFQNNSIILTIDSQTYIYGNESFFSTQQINVTIPEYVEIQYLNFSTNISNITVICPDIVTLHNSTKDEFIYRINDQINKQFDIKTEDIKAKISDDILFQLKPTQAQFDNLELSLLNCKDNITIAQKDIFEANIQQEKWYLQYIDCQEENNNWLWLIIIMFFLIVIILVFLIQGGLPFFGFKPKIRL